jgi:hypothetical protein
MKIKKEIMLLPQIVIIQMKKKSIIIFKKRMFRKKKIYLYLVLKKEETNLLTSMKQYHKTKAHQQTAKQCLQEERWPIKEQVGQGRVKERAEGKNRENSMKQCSF